MNLNNIPEEFGEVVHALLYLPDGRNLTVSQVEDGYLIYDDVDHWTCDNMSLEDTLRKAIT